MKAVWYDEAMQSIREAIHNVIADRILPWIERDGIGKLILPEQITPDDCDKTEPCKGRRKGRFRREELAIGLTGKATYCIGNKTFIFTPGRMVLLPAGTPHAPVQATSHLIDDLDPDLPSSTLWMRTYPLAVWTQILRVVPRKDVLEATRPHLLRGRHFNRLMTSLLEEVRSRPPNYAGVGQGILIEFMHRCLRASSFSVRSPIVSMHHRLDREFPQSRRKSVKSKSKNFPGRVQAAKEFINSNYHMSINLENIAEAADSSTGHLCREFKTATGMTLMQYLAEVRMETARQLLLTELKVSEIALLVGIDDHCYFSRLFRRINGVNPARYRRAAVKAARAPRPRNSTRRRKS